jgi:predicted PurR-regulated permease PerM
VVEDSTADDKHDEAVEAAILPALFDAQSVAIKGIFLIAFVYFLYFAAPVLIPITLALLISTMLSPIQRQLLRLKVPAAIGASLIVFSMTAGAVTTAYVLASPAQSWLQRVPLSFHRLESNLKAFKQPLQELQEASEKLEEATKIEGDGGRVTEVRMRAPSVSGALLNSTTQILISAGIVVVLVLFFLLNTDGFLSKLVGIIPTLSDKKRAVEIVRNIQEDIAHYLFVLTLINAGLGVVMGVVAALLGLPNPILWSALVMLLSFAPYAGSSLTAIILTMVGMLHFDALLHALIAPAIFLILIFLYGNVLIPYTLGRRLSLSPVAIFLAIIFWGWLWGIPGALLAVPILASFKIVCDRFPSLRNISEFLSP